MSIVLELCHYGSLGDILRGRNAHPPTFPLSLTATDELFLALGCARYAIEFSHELSVALLTRLRADCFKGLAALHASGRDVCHRDVKSFNYLGMIHIESIAYYSHHDDD